MKKILVFMLVYMLSTTCLVGCSQSSSSSSPSPSSSSKSSSSSSSSSGSSSSSPSPSEDTKTGNISASGSIVLQPLLTQAVGTYKSGKEFTGTIAINGGGSAQGISDVASGKVDIGDADISPEQAGLDGSGLVDHQIGIVAVGVVVSSDVAANLKGITTSDLKDIYSGKITDWEKVAGWKGTSLPISGYYYKSGSGIRFIFDSYGIKTSQTDAQYKEIKNLIEIDSPKSLQKAIGTGKGVIGYDALPFCSKLTLLTVDSAEPTYENVYSGKYKMWGCEHMYTMGEPIGAVKAFIEYLTSSDFEKTITSNGYGIISEMKVSR